MSRRYWVGLAVITACSEPTPPPVPVAAIEVMPDTTGVVIGQTVQLTATLKDAAGNELRNRSVTWSSSAPAQASVSVTGLVTGISLGDSVAIVATSEGKSDTASLAVVMDLAGEWNFTEQLKVVVLESPNLLTQVGTCSDTGSYRFTQNGAEIGGTIAQVGTCQVTPAVNLYVHSHDNSLSLLMEDGRVTSTHIHFSVPNGCSYEGDVVGPPASKLSGTYWCLDIVRNLALGTWEATPGGAPVTAVTVRWDAQAVVGGAVQLLAVPRDAAGNVLDRAMTWSRSGGPVPSGLITGLTAGAANITATSEGIPSSATITANLVTFSTVSAADGFHSCGLTSTGAAYCWGWGGDGQLGIGFRPIQGSPLAAAETPLAVAGAHTFTQVDGGLYHNCGITPTGDAYCWGDNAEGQLGDGSTTSSLVPVAVTGGHRFTGVTAGYFHSCGVTTAHEVYCWGSNYTGQLGGGGTAGGSTSAPQLVTGGLLFQTVRADYYGACGITLTSAAYCWGLDQDGQVGNGTTMLAVTTPAAVQGGQSFATVAVGFSRSCGVALDGTAYCWGDRQTTPVQVAGGPFATADGAMTAGAVHTCALTPAGAAYCWGDNSFGQLGDGSTISRSAPVPVSSGLTFATLSAGGNHTCGMTTGGVAFCWGDNEVGELGSDAPASCVINNNGNTYTPPCATTPMGVVGQPGTAAALRLEGYERRDVVEPVRWRRSRAQGLLPAPSFHLPHK